MKNRTDKNGSNNDDWETPDYILDYIKKRFFNDEEYFDPCPLKSIFNGLDIEWGKNNYINPPYSRPLKEEFIKKAYKESLLGKTCVMLIPANTDTAIFHDVISRYGKVYLLKKRVKFKGINTKGVYVTDKSGQGGSMIVIFDKNIEPSITTLHIREE